MLEDLQKLIELQQIDREIHRLNEEVAALPRKVSEIESKLATTKAQLDQAQATIKNTGPSTENLEISGSIPGSENQRSIQSIDARDQLRRAGHP